MKAKAAAPLKPFLNSKGWMDWLMLRLIFMPCINLFFISPLETQWVATIRQILVKYNAITINVTPEMFSFVATTSGREYNMSLYCMCLCVTPLSVSKTGQMSIKMSSHLFISTVVRVKLAPFNQRIMKSLWQKGQFPTLSASMLAWQTNIHNVIYLDTFPARVDLKTI